MVNLPRIALRKVIVTSCLILLITTFTSISSTNALSKNIMDVNEECKITPLKRSQDMIYTILDDISKKYTHVGGGGITQIKQTATNTFVVLIAQEERMDKITYELEVREKCEIMILKKDLSVVSY